jgi:replication-associated recombination protein RarA
MVSSSLTTSSHYHTTSTHLRHSKVRYGNNKGYNYIRNTTNDTVAQKYIQFVFDTQSYFNELSWRDKSIADFIANFSGVVSQNIVNIPLNEGN